MDDLELLELAAKAACMKVLRCPACVLRDCTGLDPAHNIFAAKPWHPLVDDGDALRLAGTLGLVVDCSRPSAGEPFKMQHCAQADFTDKQAAIRRAIVRAAANIGKGMK